MHKIIQFSKKTNVCCMLYVQGQTAYTHRIQA